MNYLTLVILLAAPFCTRAQSDTASEELHIPQTFMFEREDGASIHYLPPGEIEGSATYSFSFFADEEDCFEGPAFSLPADKTGNVFTYKIKGVVFLILEVTDDKIIVTQKECPAAGPQCVIWSGVYLKLEGRY